MVASSVYAARKHSLNNLILQDTWEAKLLALKSNN
jgi:hypothetical protein